MTKLRILLAEDHTVVRQGLRRLLEAHEGWQICGEAGNGRDAVAKAKRLKPDVAIVDLKMPRLAGVEATRQIVKHTPQTQVLILSMYGSRQLVRDALSAGARGYLLKTDAEQDLVAAVEVLSRGKPFLPSLTTTVSESLLEGLHRSGEVLGQARNSELTRREAEIVPMLAQGRSNKEVASKLGISVRTVEVHRANIMRKLECYSFSDLVRYAIHNDIVDW